VDETWYQDIERPTSGPDLRAAIADAARVLAALDLVTAFGHVSARDGEHMLITPAAALGEVRSADLVAVPLDATVLSCSTRSNRR
jgi:ribulose-5-phosphate 4-epimerase/fuculose-1-phosphate aldolase